MFIAIVSNHCKKFNFTKSLFFFKKQSKLNCFMLCFNQFLLPILNLAFCVRFIHRYWFWCSIIISRLAVINQPKEHSSMFKRLSECKHETFSLRAFIKPFKALQRSMKIKTYVNFYSNSTFWNAQGGKG